MGSSCLWTSSGAHLWHRGSREGGTHFGNASREKLTCLSFFHSCRMAELGLHPSENQISFGQLLGMCDHITFPLGKSLGIPGRFIGPHPLWNMCRLECSLAASSETVEGDCGLFFLLCHYTLRMYTVRPLIHRFTYPLPENIKLKTSEGARDHVMYSACYGYIFQHLQVGLKCILCGYGSPTI